MSIPLYPPYVFPELLEVESWHSNLQAVGYHPNYKEFIPVRDGTFVTTLFFCKDSKGLQHEYIVADLCKPGGDYIHAKLDRCGSNLRPEPSELRAQRDIERMNEDSVNSTSTSSLSSSNVLETLNGSSGAIFDRVQKPSKANDRVQFSRGRFRPPPNSVIKRYEFQTGHQPSLIELAIAALVARRYDTYYSLFRHQCYWYADCVCVVIEEIVGKDNFTITDSEKARAGRDEDDIELDAIQLRDLKPTGRRRGQTVACGATDAIELEGDQWSKLKPGTHTVKIFTRKPVVVHSLRRCLGEIKQEWRQLDEARVKDEQLRRQDTEGRQKAELKVEELSRENGYLNQRIQDLEAQLARQAGSSSGLMNGLGST